MGVTYVIPENIDKLYYRMLYRVHLSKYNKNNSLEIGTD